MQVSQHDRKYIWENCVSVVPSLKDGKVVQDWVGLRPFRQPIRVEAELLGLCYQINARWFTTMVMVPSGVQHVRWGTAMDATHLVPKPTPGLV
uniref:Putative d-aspartate oxidase n=1 Tax=Ixodes ricinus TaxID=34613 RepID=A0A090XB04_IXORI